MHVNFQRTMGLSGHKPAESGEPLYLALLSSLQLSCSGGAVCDLALSTAEVGRAFLGLAAAWF